MSDLYCKGLASSSVLAYLAVIGLLRTVSGRIAGTSMSWSWQGWWRPTLHVPAEMDEEALLDLLEAEFKVGSESPYWPVKFQLGGPTDEFLQRLQNVAALTRSDDRTRADWWSSYGSETVERENEKGKRGVEFSPWIYLHGQGGQHFLDALRAIQNEDPKLQATRQRLREALFSLWAYQARAQSVLPTRWDPIDTQNHATCARNPNKDKNKPCMPGAVRLAAEALPLLAAVPTADGIAAPAYVSSAQVRKQGQPRGLEIVRDFSVVGLHFLPIWDGRVGIDTVRSLLTHPVLCSLEEASQAELRQLGLLDRLMPRCTKSGKYRRSTAASSCL